MNKDWSSDEIKKLRKKLKMSQNTFAVCLDVVQITIHRWEKGESRPTLLAKRALSRLARKVKK